MSKKDKRSLSELQISSFATSMEREDMEQVKGGAMLVRGRRFTFRVRWTTVDTRVETGDKANGSEGN